MVEPYPIFHVLGPESHTLEGEILALARYFSRLGHPVTVISSQTRLQQRRLAEAGARWVNLSLPGDQSEGAWPTALRQLRRLLADPQPRLVHSHGPTAAIATRWATRSLSPPPGQIISLPGLGAHHFPFFWRLQLRQALSRADRIILQASADLEVLQRLHPPSARQCEVIPHAVEVRPLRSDFDVGLKRRALGVRPESAVIGVVSPSLRGLGLESFVEAAARINQDFPNVEFLLVGEGSQQRELKALAHQLGAGGAMIFRGSRADVPEIIGSLNVLVIPREIPGAIEHALQAVIQEVPVVAARSPALTEVLEAVDPEALVPADDVGALVAALAQRLELLPDSEERPGVFLEGGLTLNYRDMLVSTEAYDLDQSGLEAQDREGLSPPRQAALKAMQRYSPRRMIEATERLYQEVMQVSSELTQPQSVQP